MAKPKKKSRKLSPKQEKLAKKTSNTKSYKYNDSDSSTSPSDSADSDSDSNSDPSDDTNESSDHDESSPTRLPSAKVITLTPPIKNPADPNLYRAIQLANGLKVILISSGSNSNEGRHKRVLEDTPSQSNQNEIPTKRSRPFPPTQYNSPKPAEISLREAIEKRMLDVINECLNFAPTPEINLASTKTQSTIASAINMVKVQVREFLAGSVKNLLDEFMPDPKIEHTLAAKPAQQSENSENETFSLTDELKQIFTREIKNLIEEAKTVGPVGLLINIGIGLEGRLGANVTKVLLTQVGILLAKYMARKFSNLMNETPLETSGSSNSDRKDSADEKDDSNSEQSNAETSSTNYTSGICGGSLVLENEETARLTSRPVEESMSISAENIAANNQIPMSISCENIAANNQIPNEVIAGLSNCVIPNFDMSQNDTMTDTKYKLLRSASVSLTIPCGSIRDDEDCPGISDLCRRLLSMDPCYLHPSAVENTIFTTFTHLSKSGGETNYCELKQLKCVSKLLDFPKLEKEDILRVMSCPDQNGAKSFQKTFHRSNPLLKTKYLQLLYSLAKFDHPLRFISPGCHKAKPNKNLKDDELLRSVQTFWCKFYRVEDATLAVESAESLDAMERDVVKHFGNVECKSGPSKLTIAEPDPFDTSEFRRLFRVIPKFSTRHLMILTWGFPAQFWRNCHGVPLEYVSKLLSYKGPGSLFHSLASRGLVTSMHGGCSRSDYHRNEFCSLFQICFELSDNGVQCISVVTQEVFLYLKFIIECGPDPFVFQEMQISQSMLQSYGDTCSPKDQIPFVSRISRAFQFNSSENILSEPQIPSFDTMRGAIADCMATLCPADVNIMLITKRNERDRVVIRNERYFGTRYYSEKVPQGWLPDWEILKIPDPARFTLAQTNSFDAQLLTFPDIPANIDPEILCPVELERNKMYALWHKYDQRCCGIVALVLNISNSMPLDYIESSASLHLLHKIMENKLAAEFYDAQNWNAFLNIEPTSAGFSLKISCHKNRICHLTRAVISKIKGLEESLNNEEFQYYTQFALHDFHAKMTHSTFIAENLFEFMARKCTWKITDLAKELERMQAECALENFTNFLRQFYLGAFLEMLVVGNLTIEEAREIMVSTQEIMQNEGCAIRHLENPLLQWPQGSDKYLQIKSFNPQENKTLISKYYQLGLVELISKVAATVVCDLMVSVLMHRKKAGESWYPNYDIYIYLREFQGMLFFQHDAVVPSNSCWTLKAVDKMMDDFMINFFTKILKRISNPKFEAFRNSSLKCMRNEKYTVPYLQEEIKYLSKEMGKPTFGGACFREILDISRSIDLKTIRRWYEQNLLITDANCLAVAMAPARLCIKILPNANFAGPDGKSTNQEYCAPDMTSLQFWPLTCEEQRKEWSPDRLHGTYITKINQYKSSLLVHQAALPENF